MTGVTVATAPKCSDNLTLSQPWWEDPAYYRRGRSLTFTRGYVHDKWTTMTTEDGSVNAVPQILYGQYLILGAKFFCRKKNQLHFPIDKGLTVPN